MTTTPPRGAPDVPARTAALRHLAHLWDTAVRIPGTSIRFGLDAVIGLVPGLGDAVGALVAATILLGALREGAPPALLARMLANLGLDALGGVVPVLGDLFDLRFRANTRNVALLEAWFEDPARTRRRSRGVLVTMAAGMLLAVAALAVGVVWLASYIWRWLIS